ncbi:MAG: cyclase family protein, partial [Candidatus Microthrix parvicella]
MAFSEELRELAQRISNWGRWGDDDQRGTGNLLTPEAARRGAESVVDGTAIPLALPLLGEGKGVQIGQPAGRLNAVLTFTTMNERDPMAPGIWTGCDDQLTMSTSAGTHMDALSHVAYDGLLYNGRSTDTIGAASGATWCGAEQLRPISTRAILVDVPRTLEIEFMDPGQPVTGAVLDAAMERARVTPEPGDVLLVRTGDVRHYLTGDRRRYAVGKDWKLPGIGVS